MGELPLSLRAMVYSDEREWIAHCLDLDFVETGDTPYAAIEKLVQAVSTQVEYTRANDNFTFLFQPAPHEAWQRLGGILRGPYKTVLRPLESDFTLESLLAA